MTGSLTQPVTEAKLTGGMVMQYRHALPCLGLFLAAASCLCPASLLAADIFQLRSGGEIRGEWLNAKEQPLNFYSIRTESGIVVQLHTTAVREVLRPSADQTPYESIAPTFPDTVEGQWELAEWCRERHLTTERKKHLERVLELDPNHQKARQRLGYAFIDGKWVTQEESRREEGYEYYRGKWRTAQEIEILETEAKLGLSEREWLTRLRRWRAALNGDKARPALVSIRSIDDPVAVRPLAYVMRQERVRHVKMLYADVLANINSAESVHCLVQASLADRDEEIFYYCLRLLTRLQPPNLVDPYVAALQSPNNFQVNRAAIALAQIGNQSAISPLIDALITLHFQVKSSQFGPEATAVSFDKGGGSSMMRNAGPQVLVLRTQNQHVLDALTKLSSGSNFGYDQTAWRYWYAQEKRMEQAGQRVERRE